MRWRALSKARDSLSPDHLALYRLGRKRMGLRRFSRLWMPAGEVLGLSTSLPSISLSATERVDWLASGSGRRETDFLASDRSVMRALSHGRAGKRGDGAVLGNIVRIAANILYVAVVWFVLDQVHNRPEAVILPVLGILYVTTRSMGMGAAHTALVFAYSLESIERRIKAQAGEYIPDEADFVSGRDQRLKKAGTDMLIDGTGLGVISLLCLWKFLGGIGVL